VMEERRGIIFPLAARLIWDARSCAFPPDGGRRGEPYAISRGGATRCQGRVLGVRSYAVGKNDAGMTIFVCWLTGLSPLWGGQEGSFIACSRIRCRDARSAYGQICIQRFSPPTSLDIHPAIGESLERSGSAFSQASSTFGMPPGAYV